MNTSPKNKVFAETTCLSLDQLKLYHEDKLTPKQKHEVENHLLDCELCSAALAGFGIVAITAADMADVNKRIDSLSGAQAPSLISLKTIFSMAAAVVMCVSFYFVYRSFSSDKTKTLADTQPNLTQQEMFSSGKPPENTIVLDNKNTDVKALLKLKLPDPKQSSVEQVHPNEAFTMEMLEMKSPDIILSSGHNDLLNEDQLKVPVLILGTDTFVLDLKITDYDKFYFVNMSDLKQAGHNTDPVFENDKDRDNSGVYKLQEWEVTTTAQVLKSALTKFNAQDYENAAKLFNALIKHNSDDVNALFYGGVCYFNNGNPDKALDYFTRVISSNNGSFYEEAKWYKALTYLKKHDKETAQKLLKEIVASNGFYKDQAKEKLKEF